MVGLRSALAAAEDANGLVDTEVGIAGSTTVLAPATPALDLAYLLDFVIRPSLIEIVRWLLGTVQVNEHITTGTFAELQGDLSPRAQAQYCLFETRFIAGMPNICCHFEWPQRTQA